MIELLTFVPSELHNAFVPLFAADATEAEKSDAKTNVARRFDHIEAKFGVDETQNKAFTIADAYLFVVANWANFLEIDLAAWPQLQRFVTSMAERASVQKTMRAEGLVQ